jgi:hypothetical protein
MAAEGRGTSPGEPKPETAMRDPGEKIQDSGKRNGRGTLAPRYFITIAILAPHLPGTACRAPATFRLLAPLAAHLLHHRLGHIHGRGLSAQVVGTHLAIFEHGGDTVFQGLSFARLSEPF